MTVMGILLVQLWIWSATVNGDSDASACPVTQMGTPENLFSPFLVKIVERVDGTFTAKAHGSLIHLDRIVSTCGPFNDYSENVDPHDIWIIGVNIEDEDCDQRKPGTRVLLHPSCKNKDPIRYLIKYDFAIWLTGKWQISGYAYNRAKTNPSPPGRFPLYDYYFQFPEPKWLKYTMMFMALSECESGNRCKFPVFEYYKEQTDRRLDHVRRKQNNDSLSYIQYIGWEQCKKEHVPAVYKQTSPDAWYSQHAFFCGYNIGQKPASDRESTQKGGIADWFSGAVVVCKEGKPLGFASRHVEYSDPKQPGSTTSDVQVRIFVSLHGWDKFTNWMEEVLPLSFGCVNRGSFFTTTLLILLFISQK